VDNGFMMSSEKICILQTFNNPYGEKIHKRILND